MHSNMLVAFLITFTRKTIKKKKATKLAANLDAFEICEQFKPFQV